MRRALAALIVGLCLFTPTAADALSRTAETRLHLAVSSTHVHVGHLVAFRIRLRSDWKKCRARQPIRWYRDGVYDRTLTTGDRGWVRIRLRLYRTATFRAKYPGQKFGTYPDRNTCEPSSSHDVTVTVGR